MAGKPRASSRKKARSEGVRSAANAGEVCALEAELNQARCEIARAQQELEALRAKAKDAATAKTALQRISRELEQHTLQMEQQVAVARQFQSLFNPPILPRIEGVNFTVKYQPCARVGGDLYDVFDMGSSCVGILVADITGYGLAATLITAAAKMAFDTFRQNEYSPKAIMEQVNAHVLRHTLGNQFLTVFLGVLDIETLRMKYVNAGNPCPVVYSAGRFELLDTDGLCCGIVDEPLYEEKEVSMQPGDRILIFTRGLPDMHDADGNPYTSARLYEFLRQHRDIPVGDVVGLAAEDFEKHMNGAEHIKDLTVLGLELVPRETTEERVVIPSDPKMLHKIENRVIEQLETHNYGERVLFAVRLAVEEAVINAIKHGNKMDKTKNVTVTYSIDDKECVISVTDEGEGFNPAAVPDPTADENLELPHGRGLMLIRAYMDEVKFNEKGNCVTMRKLAPWAE